MLQIHIVVSCALITALSVSAMPPTLYELYTLPKIDTGLSTDQSHFTLNGRNITLYSGAMHYFRVPKAYWRDRLRKIRAAGLNTVETIIPWNLHEPENGKFEFGNGGSDMENFADIKHFFEIVKEEDLLAIARPGPFVAGEWDFGGLPSWLLRTKDIKVRTSDSKFMRFVTRYFEMLLSILSTLQFCKGGPIIAFQVENEYGRTEGNGFVPDKQYIKELVDIFQKNGIRELLFTSDVKPSFGDRESFPNLLQTLNFGSNASAHFDNLKEIQPNKPLMCMEFWTGWFDHWSEFHHTTDVQEFARNYEQVLTYPASVNMFLFHGGTTWGFFNGANVDNQATDNSGYQPVTTSYDFDAPLTESGDYTEKYMIAKKLIKKYNKIVTRLPESPAVSDKVIYPKIPIEDIIVFEDIVEQTPYYIKSLELQAMELLPINNNSGQSYGYLLYRRQNLEIPANSILTIKGRVCDSVLVLINGILMSKPLNYVEDLNSFGFWRTSNFNLTLGTKNFKNATLDLIVENWGRINFGLLPQFKGLWQGPVLLNNHKITNWLHIPIEFKKSWNNNLVDWKPLSGRYVKGPSLYRATLFVKDPKDTFINMESWTKGIVVVNGFVLGRYARIGPQQTLYFPAPLQNKGNNTILIFEHYAPAHDINFAKRHYYKTNQLGRQIV